MASTYTSAVASSNRPAISSCEAGEVIAVRGEIDLAVDVGGALVINDVLNMVKLPAQHVPVDVIIDSADLDSGGSPAIVIDAGLGDDVDAFISGSTVCQAGGVARMAAVAGIRAASSDSDQYATIKVTTAPATGATTGKIGLTLLYRARNQGE